MGRRLQSSFIVASLLLCAALFIFTGGTCSEIYTRQGVWYRVQKGDTISGVSSHFGISQESLLVNNKLSSGSQLKAGERLYIPSNGRIYAKSSGSRRVKPPQKDDKEIVAINQGKFIWPVKGVISSTYGNRRGRKHNGIDISAPRGRRIVASASGEVVFSSRLRGYGNLILLKHRGNIFSVYAHNSRNLVKKGKQVKKGQVIARIGSTGRATGPHLHFEIRRGSHPRDPLKYLPKLNKRIATKGSRVGG